MERMTGIILDASGNPLSGVSVAVKLAGTATNAVLYADNGITSLANPFTNDSNGTFEFYAPNGRYDVQPTKTGVTFTQTDWNDLELFDPLEDADYYAALALEGLSLFNSGATRIYDGQTFVTVGTNRLKTPTTTYKNGWIELLGDGAAAPSMAQWDLIAAAIHRPFVITADALIFECRIERVTATAATVRIGLADANLSAGDPPNGVYIRQIDSNNAFLVVRSGSADSGTVDLGTTIASAKKIRITMTTTSIRVLLDGVSKGTVTTSIPSSIMLGLSAMASVVTAGVGLAVDYAKVWSKR